MRIYRIEDKLHRGPYWNNPILDFSDWDTVRQPGPMNDFPSTYLNAIESRAYIYGFASMGQLWQWFGDKFNSRKLVLHKMYIAKYEANERDVIFGSKQIAFKSGRFIRHTPFSNSLVSRIKALSPHVSQAALSEFAAKRRMQNEQSSA